MRVSNNIDVKQNRLNPACSKSANKKYLAALYWQLVTPETRRNLQ